jgi:hypothetical protein
MGASLLSVHDFPLSPAACRILAGHVLARAEWFALELRVPLRAASSECGAERRCRTTPPATAPDCAADRPDRHRVTYSCGGHLGPWATLSAPIADGYAKPTYPNIAPQPSLTPQIKNRRSDHNDIAAIVALAHSPTLERLASLMCTPAGPLDRKGNLSDGVQPILDCCDDLSRYRWTECRRVPSHQQSNDARCQRALYDRALVLSRSVSGSRMSEAKLSVQRSNNNAP